MSKCSSNLAGLARAMAALMVCAAMCGGALASAPEAWAADITINEPSDVTQDVTYKGYLVFNAMVAADNKATDVTWNDAHKTAVLAYLNGNGYDKWLTNQGHITASSTDAEKAAARESAQNAAEFISAGISGSAPSGSLVKDADSFAIGLAKAVAADTAEATSSGGKLTCNNQGLWLVAADASTVAGDPVEAGTAPIWLPVGTSDKTVESKAGLPTFAKQVKEDSTAAWGTYADANVGQAVDYKLTVTLPSNLNAFSSYQVKVVDTLATGLEFASAADGVSVKVGSTSVTTAASISGNVLTVDITDVKQVSGATAGAEVTIEYQARLKPGAAKGSAGNANSAVLTYTKDPVTLETAQSVAQTTKLYTYQLDVLKVAKEDESTKVAGAAFTVRAGDAQSTSYVQADGSVSSTAHEFVTDSNGAFQMPGLDEGTYTITETRAPEAYNKLANPVTLVVTSTIGTYGLTKLDMTATGGDGTESLAMSPSVSHDANGAAATLTIKDAKRTTPLPLTGMTPSQMATVVGALLFVAGLGIALACRRMARK